MNDEILTIPEVAELLRIAEKTVYTLAQRGEIPAFKVGGQWRFSWSAIQLWIDNRTRAGQPSGAESTRAAASGESSAGGAAKKKARRRP
jgi:excisionase family DNA binding protein